MIFCLLAGMASGAMLGCGREDTNVTLSARAISQDTRVPFFSMGHDAENLPFGGVGTIGSSTSTWTASIEFVDVPEGDYIPRYDGYGVIPLDIAFVGSVQGYCEIEWGLADEYLSVTKGGRNRAEIITNENPGCTHVGVDSFIANPNYEFDPQHRLAGSMDGENIIMVYVDGIEPLSDIDFRVCDDDLGQGCDESPFGIFPDLPDPPYTVWPDPTYWESEEMLIRTDIRGDAVGYLVVKPGATPTNWEVRFVDEDDDVEVIYLRISNTNTITITVS